ncbi:MAG: hypothetical protein NT006_07460 [Candidatus Aminicenantes bacterium]|nr:hypothetical protein [Candidatus Aminicenantes bacterium]
MFKKTLLLIAALALAALILIVPAWPGTVPTSIVPEGARWVAHLDMEKFVATKLYEYLEKDGRLQIKNRDIGRWLKIDLFKDITGLTVFGLESGDKQAVFAVTGKFDKAGLLALLALDKDYQAIPYGSYTLYLTGSDEFGAFVNDGLIVFSENREAVEKVLDTAAGKTKSFASSKLNAAFKDVSSGTFLSGVVEDLAGLGKEINQSKFVEKASMMFFLAQEKQDNLQVRVQVTADSPESAKNMADVAQGLIAMVRLGQGEGPGGIPASLVEGLQVKLEGKTVRLELDMPSREVANLAPRGRGLDLFD